MSTIANVDTGGGRRWNGFQVHFLGLFIGSTEFTVLAVVL